MKNTKKLPLLYPWRVKKKLNDLFETIILKKKYERYRFEKF